VLNLDTSKFSKPRFHPRGSHGTKPTTLPLSMSSMSDAGSANHRMRPKRSGWRYQDVRYNR
jgi:hypothetical protein